MVLGGVHICFTGGHLELVYLVVASVKLCVYVTPREHTVQLCLLMLCTMGMKPAVHGSLFDNGT